MGYFFPFYPPNDSKNLKFQKNENAHGDVMITMYGSWNILHEIRMDRQTNGQVEKATYNHYHKPVVQKVYKNKQLICSQSLTNPQSLCSHAFYLSNQSSVIHSWDTTNIIISWPDWPHSFLTIPTLKLLK